MNTERRLYIIPIAHSPADMGSLRGQIPTSEKYDATVTKYWVEVGRFVRDTFINGGVKVDRVYQDGLPDVSEEDVAKVVAQVQTANYEILRWLKSQGTLIRGTEDLTLLLKEVQNLTTLLHPPQDEEAWLEARITYAQVLYERDDYINQRIQQDFLPGETGILFIGAAHDVGRRLKSTMCVLEPKDLLAKFPKAYFRNRRT